MNEKGIPSSLAAVHLRAPERRIGRITSKEAEAVIGESNLVQKYNVVIKGESTYEILSGKLTKNNAEVKEQVKQNKKE